MTQRVQFTSVNRFNSRLHLISYGVPQGSVLGPLLFIIFFNDLHKSIRHSQMLHFSDDTNLLYINKSMKKINKHISHDLPLLFNGWYLTRSVWTQVRLNWKNIIPKLSRAISVLSKTRHYVPSFLLKTTYYSIFNFHLIYTCQVWGQNENCLKKLFSLQNKAIIITLTIRNKLQKTRLSS